jgi:hypothetical protein
MIDLPALTLPMLKIAHPHPNKADVIRKTLGFVSRPIFDCKIMGWIDAHKPSKTMPKTMFLLSNCGAGPGPGQRERMSGKTKHKKTGKNKQIFFLLAI